jgi:hypothetical protein
VTAPWQRPAGCEAGSCVEVQRGDGWIELRDGEDPDSPTLVVAAAAWAAFVAAVKAGEYG